MTSAHADWIIDLGSARATTAVGRRGSAGRPGPTRKALAVCRRGGERVRVSDLLAVVDDDAAVERIVDG